MEKDQLRYDDQRSPIKSHQKWNFAKWKIKQRTKTAFNEIKTQIPI
jgi:hypothetical protein